MEEIRTRSIVQQRIDTEFFSMKRVGFLISSMSFLFLLFLFAISYQVAEIATSVRQGCSSEWFFFHLFLFDSDSSHKCTL